MCLSTVFIESNGVKEKIADCVTAVDVNGETISVTDIVGSVIEVIGTIKNVDLIANTLVLEKTK